MAAVLLAGVTDTGYEIVKTLHILAAIVAFAPAVVHPIAAGLIKDRSARRAFSDYAAKATRMVYLPALIVLGVLGFALVGMSDDAWSFGDAWISISILLWIAIGGVVSAVVAPAERKLASGDDASAENRVRIGGTIATLLVIVVVFLMTAKPGA